MKVAQGGGAPTGRCCPLGSSPGFGPKNIVYRPGGAGRNGAIKVTYTYRDCGVKFGNVSRPYGASHLFFTQPRGAARHRYALLPLGGTIFGSPLRGRPSGFFRHSRKPPLSSRFSSPLVCRGLMGLGLKS